VGDKMEKVSKKIVFNHNLYNFALQHKAILFVKIILGLNSFDLTTNTNNFFSINQIMLVKNNHIQTCSKQMALDIVKISLISYVLFLLLLFFICILDLAHMFFIINTVPMCIFYTREINLNPIFSIFNRYFLCKGEGPNQHTYGA